MLKQSIVAALVAALAATIPLRAEIVEQVLVKVNGEIITKTEFEARQVAELRNRPELAKVSASNAELQRAVAEITPDLILDAVDELLLVQRGRESGYALGDQQFASIVENIRKSNNLEDEARFKEALKQEGLTMDDLRRNLERQMLVSQVTARRDPGEDQHQRRRGARLLRSAPQRVHVADGDHAARDSDRSADIRSRCQRRAGRRRASQR